MSVRLLITLLFLVTLGLCPAGAASDIDLSKAVKIGNGPKTVIEFTDPDCPFCRKASAYFKARSDVTRYVYFSPLPTHPHARQKVQYILSGSDSVQLYQQVMTGGVDRMNPASLPITSQGRKLQEEQHAIARKVGVDGTPTFMIMGRIIEGFDLKRIEELLGK